MTPDSAAGIGNTVGSLALALLLGAVIGAERQYRERIASLRTNVLVALGAAAFVDLGIQMGGSDGAMRVLANVVTGVGFLGAGLILREGGTIRGLNTAATVWCSAAVGAAAGANLPYACKAAVCCTCRARVLEGDVRMDRTYTLEPQEIAKGFVLTCQSHPMTDHVVISFDER